MRHRMMILLHGVAVAVVLTAASLVSVSAQERDLPASEEIRRSFQLAPGATVSISTVSGPVDVETASGNTVDVHIVRSAQTQRELDCYRTVVEQTPTGLSIRHEQECRTVRARQRVRLSVPKDVNLRIETVSGDVHIAAIDGSVRLSSISGGVWLEQAGGDLNISSISGQVHLNITKLNQHGVRLSSISGQVLLALADSINASVRVSSISGDFDSEIPGVTVDKVGDSDYRAQIGRGGAPISISSVSGSVTLRRA
jgi:Putative adhesin